MVSVNRKPAAVWGSDVMAGDATAFSGKFRWLSPLPIALLITACSQAPVRTDVSPELAAQRQTFNTRCSGCHALPAARRHNYEEWQILLGVMEQRMKERGMSALSAQDRAAILAYLKRNGR